MLWIKQYLLFPLLFVAVTVVSQTTEQKVWFESDPPQQRLKAVYHVNDKDPSVLEGAFTSYYENGKKSTEGSFKDGVRIGAWKYFYEGGGLHMEANMLGQESGYWKYFFENGSIKKKGEVKEGKQVGQWNNYYENGDIKSTGDFEGGLKEGVWKYFYEDSVMKASAFYESGDGKYTEYYAGGGKKSEGPIKDNKSQGIWKYYYTNGSLQAQGYENDGVKSGLWIFYHDNGEKSSEGNYKEGKQEGDWSFYHDNGTKSSEGAFNEGFKDSYWKMYHMDGGFKGEGNFDMGNGAYTEYYGNGKVKVSGKMLNDLNDSTWNYFYDDGTLEGTCDFEKGEGSYVGYYKSGAVKMKGRIVDGNKDGTWELYDKKGKVIGYHTTIYNSEDDPVFADDSTFVSAKDTEEAEDEWEEDVEEEYADVDTTQGSDADYQYKVYPDYKYRRRGKWKENYRWFKAKHNEKRGFIVSANPLSIVANSFPVNVEFYMQERLGYELNYTIYRSPFFQDESKVQENFVFLRGFSVAAEQKFYYPNREYGMLYFSHELRYTDNTYGATTMDSIPSGAVQTRPRVLQSQVDYSLMFGSRTVTDVRNGGFTFDIYIGLGIGYRFTENQYVDTDFVNDIFNGVSRTNVYVPPRFGFSFGYLF